MQAGVSTSPIPVSPLAASATVPLSFIGSGLVAGLGGTLWLVLQPGLLALPHVHPLVVACAHLWLLGCLLTICAGAVYQLLPVLANVAVRSRRIGWVHLGLHAGGVAVMVPAFARGDMHGVACGGLAVSAGVICQVVFVAGTLRRATRVDPVLAAFGCATGWLALTVSVGVALAANLHLGWWSVDVLALLRMHAHMGVAGFFVTLLQGAMFRLVPMFTLGQAGDLRRVGWCVALLQGALVLIVMALAGGNRAGALAGAALMAVAFAGSAMELVRVWRTRKKRFLEPGVRGFFIGLGGIAVAGVIGGLLAAGLGNWRSALAYGVVAILGGVLATVNGMLCKIVPFLVWMRVYGPCVGRMPTPQASAMGDSRAERFWVWAHVAGTGALACGSATGIENVLTGGAWVFAAGQVALLSSIAGSASHLWRPIVPTPVLKKEIT